MPWRNLRVPVEFESTCGANLGWGRAGGRKREKKRKRKPVLQYLWGAAVVVARRDISPETAQITGQASTPQMRLKAKTRGLGASRNHHNVAEHHNVAFNAPPGL
jgi:capsule polysaccharide export protein KpsC/LpsZ